MPTLRLTCLLLLTACSPAGQDVVLSDPLDVIDRPLAACTYYAAPGGLATNDGSSPQRPFRPQDFWSVAGPGKTLCLMDGRYRGREFMLSPSSQSQPQPSGTSSSPITIRALTDGNVLIDGEGVRQPALFISPAKWFVLEGVNLCCSSESVFETRTATDYVVRRVGAWNAKDNADNMVWYPVNGQRMLFEDIFGFGIGGKMWQPQLSNVVTLRRGWFRAGGLGPNPSSPRDTLHLSYNTDNSLNENILATFPEDTAPVVAGQPDDVYRIQGSPTSTRLFGALAYARCRDRFRPNEFFDNPDFTGFFTGRDLLGVYETGCHLAKRGFFLRNHGGATGATIDRATVWGGDGMNNATESQWTVTNRCMSVAGPMSPSSACPGPFATGGNGARLCKRYIDGLLTEDALWPWPMDQRIKAALASAGRPPLAGLDGTVTSEIETLLGPIPSACRAGSPQTQPNPTAFPVTLTGTALPEERTVSVTATTAPTGFADARVLLSVYDADFSDEGALYVNGHGPIALFGASAAASNDAVTISLALTTPASWWVLGANALRFVHARTGGYAVNSASVGFINPSATPLGVVLQGAAGEEATVTLNASSSPAGFATARLTLAAYDADISEEGQLYVNGNGPIALFGPLAAPSNDSATVNLTLQTPASYWRQGTNTLRFVHSATAGFAVSSGSVSFSN